MCSLAKNKLFRQSNHYLEREFGVDATLTGLGRGMQAVSGASGSRSGKSLDKALTRAFQSIDSANTGSISKAQFESAFQNMKMPPALKAMGADALFAKMDTNGTGNISKQDFINGIKSLAPKTRGGGRHISHRNDGDANDAAGAQPSAVSASSTIASGLQSLEMALGNGQTNSDTPDKNGGTSGNNGLNVYV